MKSTIGHKKTLAEQTADRLIDRIISREFEKGQQLPNEFLLAERLDVGRGTIREAIKILASRHIVEIRRGYGTFIAQNPGQIDDPLGLTFMKNKKKLAADLYEMRLMIEPQVAALAARRATEQGLQSIMDAAKAIESSISAGLTWTEEDIAFHERIAEASDNQLASSLIPIIHSAVKVFAQLYGKPLTETTIETHREILQAIREHNPEKAEQAMIRHLQRNKEFAEDLMKSDAGEEKKEYQPD